MQNSENSTSTQNASPYLGQIPYLNLGWGNAAGLLSRGSQVPDASSQYQDLLSQRLADPQQAIRRSQAAETARMIATGEQGWQPGGTLHDFSSGKFLDPESNPYLRGTYDSAAGALGSSMDAQFAGANRYGSGAWAATRGKVLGDLSNQIYGGAYQQGKQQQLQATSLENQLGQQATNTRLQAASLYPAILGTQDTDIQNLIGLQQGQQDAPWNDLARYMGIVKGNYGGQSTSTQPMYSNPLGQGIGAAGGLASALYLGSKAFGNGTGLSDLLSGGGGGAGVTGMGFNTGSNLASYGGGGGFDLFGGGGSFSVDPWSLYGA